MMMNIEAPYVSAGPDENEREVAATIYLERGEREIECCVSGLAWMSRSGMWGATVDYANVDGEEVDMSASELAAAEQALIDAAARDDR